MAEVSIERDSLKEAVESVLGEHAGLEAELADPDVHSDQARATKLLRRYAELDRTVQCYREILSVEEDIVTAQELSADDPAFAEEVENLKVRREALLADLREHLVPKDPDDARDAIVEVRAGEGGAESALFAADLLRMYQRWAESRKWKTEVLDMSESDLGGVKAATIAIKSTQGEVYGWLKFEGGVHRVQRIPVTESQGRIHTSAAGVLVFPEVDEPTEMEISENDIRVDVFRSSGPGGQSVNTTDSAVRITHEPTGIVVSCQNEKSQLQNREAAMRMLRARLLAKAAEEAAEKANSQRRSQVRTVDRSERIRTYNFPENRITDHRTGYKSYNLDQVLAGNLDDVVESSRAAERAEFMAEL